MRAIIIFKPVEPLLQREKIILTWTARGKTRKEIGQLIGLSDETVQDYLEKTLHKLNAVNKTNAVSLAQSFGFITPYAVVYNKKLNAKNTP
jgi:DNA-binding CsgD family transcriptional regulator